MESAELEGPSKEALVHTLAKTCPDLEVEIQAPSDKSQESEKNDTPGTIFQQCFKCETSVKLGDIETILSAELLLLLTAKSIPWCCEECRSCFKCGSHGLDVSTSKNLSLTHVSLFRRLVDINVILMFQACNVCCGKCGKFFHWSCLSSDTGFTNLLKNFHCLSCDTPTLILSGQTLPPNLLVSKVRDEVSESQLPGPECTVSISSTMKKKRGRPKKSESDVRVKSNLSNPVKQRNGNETDTEEDYSQTDEPDPEKMSASKLILPPSEEELTKAETGDGVDSSVPSTSEDNEGDVKPKGLIDSLTRYFTPTSRKRACRTKKMKMKRKTKAL